MSRENEKEKIVWVKGFIDKKGNISIPINNDGARHIIPAPHKDELVWILDPKRGIRMNWKHVYLRKATEEEIEVLGCEEIWDGDVPDICETILIYQNGNYDIDYMDDMDVGIALSNNEYDDFYWCEIEKPETGNGG